MAAIAPNLTILGKHSTFLGLHGQAYENTAHLGIFEGSVVDPHWLQCGSGSGSGYSISRVLMTKICERTSKLLEKPPVLKIRTSK
jgi:hypothetical protein